MGLGWDDVLRGAEAVSTAGGSEAYRYASKDGNILGKPQTTPTAPPNPDNFQLGNGPSSDFSNQLAAQAYGNAAQQQQDQAALQGGFYNQANQNFDIANNAQMRGAPQITSTLQDKQRQLAALGGTNAAMGNVNGIGSQLQALGTKPMGDSYAAAQLNQGLNSSMAQQLSMARSGRSLGSGQAAMSQAAFNNAGLDAQTNQAAASARIQEQNAYNQFQAGALGAAGNAYGQGGALAGQAGNQATTIRSGNEGVQLQNANLGLQQQGVNNQTTGLYNSLGAQQQGFGMQANQMGQQAGEFGQQQAGNIMNTQLQANMALGGANTAVAQANNQADDAAAAQKQNRQLELVKDGVQAYASSDARQKTNIQPLELPQIQSGPGGATMPAGYTPPGQTFGQAAPMNSYGITPMANSVGPAPYIDPAWEGVAPMQAATGIGDPHRAGKDYMAAVDAANQKSHASQQSATDVLNRVPGAGAGPSASQASLLSFLQGQRAGNGPPVNARAGIAAQQPTVAGPNSMIHSGVNPGSLLVTSDQHSKTRIRELESQLAALRGPATASFAPQQPDTASLDQAYSSQGGAPRPAVDLTAARGYSYQYKDPNSPGAAPGTQVGPMAQDLEHTAGAAAVHDTPHGKQVDAPRLTMVNTAAISELQRKMQQLEALGGGQAQPAPYQASLYPQTQAAY